MVNNKHNTKLFERLFSLKYTDLPWKTMDIIGHSSGIWRFQKFFSAIFSKLIMSSRQGWLLPILYAVILLLISPIHPVFSEWGGVMQYFAGKDLLSGNGYQGWASGFWPPLFSLLVGLGSLIMPGFVAGKLIAIVSSALLLLVCFKLAMLLANNVSIAILAQIFLAFSPIYFYESLQAHNHMVDALFFNLGLLLFLYSLKSPTIPLFFIAGILCGLAGLSRYTSYVLLGLPVFLLLYPHNSTKKLSLAISLWAGFSLISLPLWLNNWIIHGSPLYSTQVLNLCAAIIPGNVAGSNTSLWWCKANWSPKGNLDLVRQYPKEYIYNFWENVIESGKLLLKYGGSLALFVIPAILTSVLLINIRTWVLLFSVLSLYVLMISQFLVGSWYLLSWAVLIVILSVWFLMVYLERIQEKYTYLQRFRLKRLTIIFLAVVAIIVTVNQGVNAYKNDWDNPQLRDIVRATQYLKSRDPEIMDKVIMAADPAWAYYAGSKYLSIPLIFSRPVEDLISYTGVPDAIKEYAPKYPAQMPISHLKADYLVYTSLSGSWRDSQDLLEYSFLLNPSSKEIPGNFKLIYQSDGIVIYEIQ